MEIFIGETKEELGEVAAEKASKILRDTIENQGFARFIAATGASQFEFLSALIKETGIDWDKTVMFHLDEYVGLPIEHKASFRGYLKERLISKINPGKVHLINGEAADPQKECARVGALIQEKPVDVAFVGIGENGHLAFNDPPADFDTEEPYIIVDLDEQCRMQQVGEGWFNSLEEVPEKAISMSIAQIMKAKTIICTVPDERKAEAVFNCLSEDKPISPEYPSSILRKHPKVYVFLDKDSARLLSASD